MERTGRAAAADSLLHLTNERAMCAGGSQPQQHGGQRHHRKKVHGALLKASGDAPELLQASYEPLHSVALRVDGDVEAVPAVRQDPLPPWSAVTALSWAGERGIVSLAAAFSIPLTLPSGEEFPFRNLLIFLTYVVIPVTLLIPAITLPWLMRWLGLKHAGENRRDEAVARLALVQTVLREVDSLKRVSEFPAELLQKTARRYERRVQTLQSNLEPIAFSPLFDEDQTLRRLTRTLLETERKELATLRRKAIIHDEVFFQLSRELDIEETRLLGQQI
jgi:hypothetical protein